VLTAVVLLAVAGAMAGSSLFGKLKLISIVFLAFLISDVTFMKA
jgi:hypothetical protein